MRSDGDYEAIKAELEKERGFRRDDFVALAKQAISSARTKSLVLDINGHNMIVETHPPTQNLLIWLAFGFGAVFVCALLALAVAIPNPTDQQFEIFRIVIAIAAAGVAAVIPGVLNVQLRHGRGFAVTAGGAFAVFVILFFYSPARWATPQKDGRTIAVPTTNHPNISAPGGNAIGGDNNGTATVNH